MHECAFCDARFPSMQALAEHLCSAHDGARWAGRTLSRSRYDRWVVTCWCDEGVFLVRPLGADPQGQFATHLRRHGGLTAHLLQITLGVDPPE
jgi:hypothetical protein